MNEIQMKRCLAWGKFSEFIEAWPWGLEISPAGKLPFVVL
jgi:hypothetical protein